MEERLLDDASAEGQALVDENQQLQQEIRELKTRVEYVTLDCQRYEVAELDTKAEETHFTVMIVACRHVSA